MIRRWALKKKRAWLVLWNIRRETSPKVEHYLVHVSLEVKQRAHIMICNVNSGNIIRKWGEIVSYRVKTHLSTIRYTIRQICSVCQVINLICLCVDQAHQATPTNSCTFSSLSHKDLYSRHVYQHVTPCQRSGIEWNHGTVRLRKSDHATDIDANNYNKGQLTVRLNDTVSWNNLDVKQLLVFADVRNIRLLDSNYYTWQRLPLHRCYFCCGLGGESVRCIFWNKVDSDERNLEIFGALQHVGVYDCIWQLMHDHALRHNIIIKNIFMMTFSMKI